MMATVNTNSSQQTRIKNSDYGYNGNPNVKRDGVEQQWTANEVREYTKCMVDPGYFARTYIKVINLDRGLVPFDLYPYQEKMFTQFNANRFNVVLACRQSGKSISSIVYILWYVIFHPEKTVAILANKGATAKEMLARVTLALENLPFFLQPGCKALNKMSIEFSNNSRIIAGATSKSSIRGQSCVAGDTKICIEDDSGNIYYTEIDKLINKSGFIEVKDSESMLYTVYRITNKVNNKVYVGFHKTNDLNDGYMGSGILIKKAISEYGIENFEKETLKVFDTKKEAEDYEAMIVDKDFTLREDTYNIAIGGNVRVMYGKNNPFYGQTHTKETQKIISEKGIGRPSVSDKIAMINGKRCDNFNQIAKALSIDGSNERHHALLACGDPNNKDAHFIDEEIQAAAEKYYSRNIELNVEKRNKLAKYAKERFAGVPKSLEQRNKISATLTGIKRDNPQNNDPEKIRKTAEKHRGMKRSAEAKQKMSEAKKGRPALNKGKRYYINPDDNSVGGYFIEGLQPHGYVRRANKK